MNYKPKVAVICAYNDSNLGMYSVDLAAREFFSELACEFDLFVAQTSRVRGARFLEFLGPKILLKKFKNYGALRYRLLRNTNQLSDYTHLVYWGDFISNPVYGKHNFSELEVRKAHSVDKRLAFQFWRYLFALSEGKPTPKVLSIGNNLQNSFQELGGELQSIIEGFRANFDLFLPRDPCSVKNMADNLGSGAFACRLDQGMDCAFLLNTPEASKERTQTFCYHFGRSGFQETSDAVIKLEKKTGLKGVPLTNWLNTDPTHARIVFPRLRRQIAEARFVFTDTYHICVNSMNLNTPVFGVGRHSSQQKGTLGDFKKKVLFEMVGLSDFYKDADSETDKQFLENMVNYITRNPIIQIDDTRVNGTFAKLNDQAGSFKEKLKSEILNF
ncbi:MULTISPECIES: polysaccharide pyruvyl transferase family protein [Marinobacter]|uniref:polysaccharide pyruvyl transferase family protein n=1 Tax=Marinobacter TaxID=2742 RepID=UPI0012468E08|nr:MULTISPECIES: polysaccharide pyruvyl transferase family protein [Marinobacter]MBL3556719.1 hypothetical protein [Marinobacter sp. JB05H06]